MIFDASMFNPWVHHGHCGAAGRPEAELGGDHVTIPDANHGGLWTYRLNILIIMIMIYIYTYIYIYIYTLIYIYIYTYIYK